MNLAATISLIKRHEALRLRLYTDTRGLPTIGYGRCLPRHPFSPEEIETLIPGSPPNWMDRIKRDGITQDQALYLLGNDVAKTIDDLCTQLPWFIHQDDVRQAVLVDMCFNLGIGGLLKFHDTLSDIQCKNYSKAAKDMLNSAWSLQVKGRARELAAMMRSGEWVL